VILDAAHVLGGPPQEVGLFRILSGSCAIDLWTSSTVLAPFSIASAINLTRAFRSGVRSVDIAVSSEKEARATTIPAPHPTRGRGMSAGLSHRRESRPPRVCHPRTVA
jgi:hypothetical protein